MSPDTNKILTKSGKMLHTGPQMDVKPIKKFNMCSPLLKIRNPKIWKKPRQPTKTPIFVVTFNVWCKYYKISGPLIFFV